MKTISEAEGNELSKFLSQSKLLLSQCKLVVDEGSLSAVTFIMREVYFLALGYSTFTLETISEANRDQSVSCTAFKCGLLASPMMRECALSLQRKLPEKRKRSQENQHRVLKDPFFSSGDLNLVG